MGHLINPVAFRLGWAKSWVDSYYVNASYYPQFMQMLLRLRLYILYFLRQKSMRELSHLYSHFNIAYLLGKLYVSVFYYDGRLEASWDSFVQASFPNKLRRSLGIFDRFVFQRFYFLLVLLMFVNSIVLSHFRLKRPLRHFLRKTNITKNRKHGRRFFRQPSKGQPRKLGKRQPLQRQTRDIYKPGKKTQSFAKTFISLFTRLVRNYFLQYIYRNSPYGRSRWRKSMRATWDYLAFGQNFFYIGISHLVSRPFFYHLGNFLSFLLSSLCFSYPVQFSFFLISNNHVTASFLANYISKRLKQGYRLMELINPLRRELRRVKQASKAKFRRLVRLASLPGLVTRLNYSSVFSRALFFLFRAHRSHASKFWGAVDSFMGYDLFFVCFYGSQQLFANAYKNFLLPSSQLLRQRFSGLCRGTHQCRPQWLFFYHTARANLYGAYIFSPLFFPNTFSLVSYPDYYFFLREAYDNLFASFSQLQGTSHTSLTSQNLSNYPIYRAISIGFGGFLRYLRFSMFKFSLTSYYNLLHLNRKQLRDSPKRAPYGLLGFKFHLKGRFTRKQIAASHVFRKGSIPLSSITANIDYAFATISLKNSAVGIKVWLYKANNLYNFYFKTI